MSANNRRASVTVAFVLTLALCLSGADATFGASSCSLISDAKIAHIIGLPLVTNVVEPETYPGVKTVHCELFVYKGQYFGPGKKYNRKKLSEQFARGNAALVEIKTFTPQPGPREAEWLASFNENVLVAEHNRQHPPLSAPSFGADHVLASHYGRGSEAYAEGEWLQTATHKQANVSVGESRQRPVVKHFTQIATMVVSPFFGG